MGGMGFEVFMKFKICWAKVSLVILFIVSGLSNTAVWSEESRGREQSAIYRTSADHLWTVLLQIIEERGETIQSLSKEEGIIKTSLRIIDVKRLQEIATVRGSEEDWLKGGYKFLIALSPAANGEIKVTVTATIVGWRIWKNLQGGTVPMRPADWIPLLSNGTLEKEMFNKIYQKL
jgi:hypothetical protein